MPKKSKERNTEEVKQPSIVPTMTLISLCIILVITFLVQLSQVRATDGYLYNPALGEKETMEDVKPITDYVKPDRMIGETDEDYEARIILAPFLASDFPTPRVVKFYSPWCGHCKNYKPKYIKIAREVNRVAPLEFYAVSCTEYKKICQNQKVQGYPTVKYFGKTAEPVVLPHDVTAENILHDYLKVEGYEAGEETENIKNSLRGKVKELAKATAKKITFQKESKNKIIRNLVFHDASLSFDFALRNGIFMTNDALDKTKSKAFKRWLELLRKAVPGNMKTVRDDVESIKVYFDSAIKSEENLLKIMGNHKHKDLKAGQTRKSRVNVLSLDKIWSENCSKGQKGAGYTCGLWELLHIISVGVVQWNTAAPENMRIATAEAAEIIKDYIANFFACEECRENFVAMYDACQFQRCERLTMDVSDTSADDWKELPLWLWETHNDVNIRLMNEARKEKNLPKATLEQEQEVRWPSKSQCRVCWMEGGGWHDDEVVKYLRTHYWHFDPLGEDVLKTMLREGTGKGFQERNGPEPNDDLSASRGGNDSEEGLLLIPLSPMSTALWAALWILLFIVLQRQRRKEKINSGKDE